MSRKTDLEEHIRESHSLIREYEDIIRLSDRPKEKLRAKGEIEGQWRLIEGYLSEYSPLAREDVPDSIEQIAHRSESWEEELERLTAEAVFGSREERRAYRNRRTMLERVKSFWVQDVLEQSLHGATLLALRMEEQEDVVEHPWNQVLRPSPTKRALPPGEKIGEVFDEMGGALLILGEPGSGKTTMLLELARETIARAERDPEQPIPVVFNLSSWADKRRPLAEWLVDELSVKYIIPKKVARPWVEDDDLLLLLDGLDEVPLECREDCVRAINEFRLEHMVPVAVCSRAAEYHVLDTRLKLGGGILLQPLTPQQVEAYLVKAGPEFQVVSSLLERDEMLQELTRTPLMLGIIALTYQGTSASDLGEFDTAEAHRKHIFDTYVQRMFERRGREPQYSSAQTLHWLSWLARLLTRHHQNQFYLEQLQPTWLPARGQHVLYVIGVSLAAGLGLGLGVGLGVTVGLGSSTGLLAGLLLGLIRALLAGVRAAKQPIRSVEKLRWSWAELRLRLRDNVVYSLSLSLLGGLSIGLVFGLGFGRSGTLARGLGIGLISGLFGGVVFTLAGGLGSDEAVDTRIRPNQGIWRSASNGLRLGPVVSIVSGLCGGVVGGLVGQPVVGLASGACGGLIDGWLLFGGEMALRHLVLRLILWRAGVLPWHLIRFLDYATERVFLRKVGGGYIFIHRLLQDYFAELWERE
jgi:hypothetical protein